jgi:hypothetical protein
VISGIGKVVPVDDQERAKQFWTTAPDELPHSPLFLNCVDIEATYALGQWS